MDRVQRQRLIPEWDQRKISEAVPIVFAPEGTPPILLDSYIRGCLMAGLGKEIFLVGRGWSLEVLLLNEYAESICSQTRVKLLESSEMCIPACTGMASAVNVLVDLSQCYRKKNEFSDGGDHNQPYVWGYVAEDQMCWYGGKEMNIPRSASDLSSVVFPSLYLVLSGILLAETVRLLMPISVWSASDMKEPVVFPVSCQNGQDLETSDGYRSPHEERLIALVGAGGIGTWLCYALMYGDLRNDYSGIVIIDPDRIEWTNLNRQCLFSKEDLKDFKGNALKSKMEKVLFGVDIQAINRGVEDLRFFKRVDVTPDYLISCVDSWKTRALLNQIAVEQGISLIDGGVDYASCNVYKYTPGVSRCLNCVLDVDRKASQETAIQSCGSAVASVVTTNMIAAGLILYMMRHQANGEMLLYDLTVPERIGFQRCGVSKDRCPCIPL